MPKYIFLFFLSSTSFLLAQAKTEQYTGHCIQNFETGQNYELLLDRANHRFELFFYLSSGHISQKILLANGALQIQDSFLLLTDKYTNWQFKFYIEKDVKLLENVFLEIFDEMGETTKMKYNGPMLKTQNLLTNNFTTCGGLSVKQLGWVFFVKLGECNDCELSADDDIDKMNYSHFVAHSARFVNRVDSLFGKYSLVFNPNITSIGLFNLELEIFENFRYSLRTVNLGIISKGTWFPKMLGESIEMICLLDSNSNNKYDLLVKGNSLLIKSMILLRESNYCLCHWEKTDGGN